MFCVLFVAPPSRSCVWYVTVEQAAVEGIQSSPLEEEQGGGAGTEMRSKDNDGGTTATSAALTTTTKRVLM